MKDVDFGILVGMALGVSSMIAGAKLVEWYWPDKAEQAELVCFDGTTETIPLIGMGVEISATAFGKGVLWSVPKGRGAPAIYWQDAFTNCHISRVKEG